MNSSQSQQRAADLVKVYQALGNARAHAEHATQHARDAKEADSTAAGFVSSIASLMSSVRTEIATAASGMSTTPGVATATELDVAKFLAVTP